MVKLLASTALAAGVLMAATAFASEVRSKGKLDVPAGMPLMVVSTDPIVQRVLSEDIAAARRTAGHDSKTLTLTVTLNQRTLRPGVSLDDVSPGDPGTAELLRAAGARAPELADTGTSRIDPYAAMAEIQNRSASETASQEFDRMSGYSQLPGFFSEYDPKRFRHSGSRDGDDIYDSAIVARAVLSDGRGELAVAAVTHPGEDPREVRKLIAEKIANALLH